MVYFSIFCLALGAAFCFEWRWRKFKVIHDVLHIALDAGAPIEEPHDVVTAHWFWLRNMSVGCNVVFASMFFGINRTIDGWLILAKVCIMFSAAMSCTRIWVNTRCDRRPKRQSYRSRVKEWAKAHRPQLAPARRPAPMPG